MSGVEELPLKLPVAVAEHLVPTLNSPQVQEKERDPEATPY